MFFDRSPKNLTIKEETIIFLEKIFRFWYVHLSKTTSFQQNYLKKLKLLVLANCDIHSHATKNVVYFRF